MDYWDQVRQNIADMRVWLAEVEAKLPPATPRPTPIVTSTIEDDVREADSATRIQKALEREFHVDRRTIYGYAERLVAAYQMDRQVPDWSTNVSFWRTLAERSDDGRTRLARGLATLDSKVAAQ